MEGRQEVPARYSSMYRVKAVLENLFSSYKFPEWYSIAGQEFDIQVSF